MEAAGSSAALCVENGYSSNASIHGHWSTTAVPCSANWTCSMGLPWQWSTLGQHRTTDAERLRFPCLIAGQRLSFSGHEEIYRCNGEQLIPLPSSLLR